MLFRSARGRPLIGRLDSDIPLLAETLPPPETGGFSDLPPDVPGLPPPDVETYAFLPPTAGADMPDFIPAVTRAESVAPSADRAPRMTFGLEEMLSTENSRTLKEIMK